VGVRPAGRLRSTAHGGVGRKYAAAPAC